ncbi:copper chaperone PCu(A)C [Marinibacterium profundimaris]|uniref:Copper-binding protein n=1 Tax=Marinibacterium profundimaris TaxID=1679460 RepID=A0A225NFK8_9RHOB|nr:copper chaperone PCu(A)C [Marinibacterium profundimaris]OWU70446.1 copper-binding protein [Marinibacterium profundimaris]
MSPKSLMGTALAACLLALPALAQDLTITDAYARASSPVAKSGAAFMVIHNSGDADDRLVAVRSDAAAKTELHTHMDMGEGVMQMREVEEGFAIPAGGMHALQRGGDHVMLMGLTEPMEQGDVITMTLVFETAGEMEVEIPVDLERQPAEMSH